MPLRALRKGQKDSPLRVWKLTVIAWKLWNQFSVKDLVISSLKKETVVEVVPK
jgi:hypothetical protein